MLIRQSKVEGLLLWKLIFELTALAVLSEEPVTFGLNSTCFPHHESVIHLAKTPCAKVQIALKIDDGYSVIG